MDAESRRPLLPPTMCWGELRASAEIKGPLGTHDVEHDLARDDLVRPWRFDERRPEFRAVCTPSCEFEFRRHDHYVVVLTPGPETALRLVHPASTPTTRPRVVGNQPSPRSDEQLTLLENMQHPWGETDSGWRVSLRDHQTRPLAVTVVDGDKEVPIERSIRGDREVFREFGTLPKDAEDRRRRQTNQNLRPAYADRQRAIPYITHLLIMP